MFGLPEQILSAIIGALATFGAEVFSKYAPGKSETKKEADKAVDEVYANLVTQITKGNIKALKILDKEESQSPEQVREKMYPSIFLVGKQEKEFDGEFRYRLEYLRVLGLTYTHSGTEYSLTALGKSFLNRYKREGL
ncbi:hypothetical protein J0X19_11715 [Hymenobacter sp. BT186]|uniref:Uncharacterized protein n=1 Tax=Hymenobacter telluris TaxID=2816474 RepID=A0A939J9A8_9BACT|nr:hypothetical protein [Hymenobacter telluris]MBO0358614.1 hypothetical protein [Hymenobacter telluris]MBW3374640.1 hypothetical protein [Hymenobacter norwichensis]